MSATGPLLLALVASLAGNVVLARDDRPAPRGWDAQHRWVCDEARRALNEVGALKAPELAAGYLGDCVPSLQGYRVTLGPR